MPVLNGEQQSCDTCHPGWPQNSSVEPGSDENKQSKPKQTVNVHELRLIGPKPVVEDVRLRRNQLKEFGFDVRIGPPGHHSDIHRIPRVLRITGKESEHRLWPAELLAESSRPGQDGSMIIVIEFEAVLDRLKRER